MAVTSQISREFTDISLSFEPNPVTRDISLIKNESAIRRSIKNLIETIPNEKFFNSTLGSNLRSSLFEPMDYGIVSVLQDQILTTINNFEGRVENVSVEIEAQPETNELEVTVVFDIIGQDFPTQEFTFVLEAAR
jgi:phage baseplate assembly protein W